MNSFADDLEKTAAELRAMPDNPTRSIVALTLEYVVRAARKAAQEAETS